MVMNRVLGFLDPVLCDAYVCDCMGYSPTTWSISAWPRPWAWHRLSTANIIPLNEDCLPDRKMPRRVRTLAATAPKDACSACCGSLIYALDRLERRGASAPEPAACVHRAGLRTKPAKSAWEAAHPATKNI